MSWIRNFFVRKTEPTEKKFIGNCSFHDWYLLFRIEMVEKYGLSYGICIASWTFSENHKKYYDKGLSPKEAVKQYSLERSNEI